MSASKQLRFDVVRVGMKSEKVTKIVYSSRTRGRAERLAHRRNSTDQDAAFCSAVPHGAYSVGDDYEGNRR